MIIKYEDFKKINQGLVRNSINILNFETFVEQKCEAQQSNLKKYVKKFDDYCQTNVKSLADFNLKFSNIIKGSGIQIDNQEILDYLENEFDIEIKDNPDFFIWDIKLKLGTVRIVTNSDKQTEWESNANHILNKTGFNLVN